MSDDDHEAETAQQAFARLEGELALMRRAVERMAIERTELSELPDYSETLARMQQGMDTVSERIAVINDVLSRSPALNVTPESMTQRIASAGSTARREEQAALANARKGLEDATRALQGVTVSARRGDEQNRWLMWMAIGGIVAGMILYAALAGVIARAAPARWLWPEKMAAQSLNMPMWDGGQRLMRAASPDTFAAVAAGDRIVNANREVLEACRKRANKAQKAVRCTVSVEATGK